MDNEHFSRQHRTQTNKVRLTVKMGHSVHTEYLNRTLSFGCFYCYVPSLHIGKQLYTPVIHSPKQFSPKHARIKKILVLEWTVPFLLEITAYKFKRTLTIRTITNKTFITRTVETSQIIGARSVHVAKSSNTTFIFIYTNE